MKNTVLLIEDDKLMRITVEDALRAAGFDVAACETGRQGLRTFKEGPSLFSVVVTDVRLPDLNGLDILTELSQLSDVPVIVMTAFGTIKDAVEAIKLGAFDYITKPFALDEFLLLIERAIEVRRLKDENIRLRKDINRFYCFPNIIGESASMKMVFSVIEKVALSDSTVLLLGESGTGKELIATTIHYQSRRKDRPIIKVNCGALPESLVESELFGHEKGAFTGAVKRRPGRFELADGGTIFLDEIADVPLAVQVKLLRVIQERTFERVGGTDTLKADVRIIAATNRSMEDEVKQGRFREDLYYRLHVIPITLPPLRERRDDIPPLVEFFLHKSRDKLLRNIRVSEEAMNTLCLYDYPGNIRELENILERCVTLSDGDMIGKEDLPPALFRKAENAGRLSLSETLAETEKDYIMRVLRSTKGNKTLAAKTLGLSRKTLWEKLKIHGVEET